MPKTLAGKEIDQLLKFFVIYKAHRIQQKSNAFQSLWILINVSYNPQNRKKNISQKPQKNSMPLRKPL